jgi:hypothetical protein
VNPNITSPPVDGAVPCDTSACAVAAYGVVRVPVEEVLGLRKRPGPSLGAKIPLSLLKHADHQTLLALAAVLRAADQAGWREGSFAEWGVIAAPRFLGRIIAAGAIHRFSQTGALGVSPLLSPTLTLHAVAGALSLAIKAHGFNYGVGGGPGHLAEALLTGLAARDDNGVPGVWVVATGFDPEPVPDVAGNSVTPSTGYAVALALTPAAEPARSRLHLRLVPTSPAEVPGAPERDAALGVPLTGLVALAGFLEPDRAVANPRPRRWYLPLPGGGAIELDDDPARAVALFERPARAG